MGQRKTQIIATVYGKPTDKEKIDRLKQLTGRTTSDLIKDLVAEKYREAGGSE